jgi:hypothetical protein
MAREPGVGRRSPYEVLFGGEGLTESRLEAIRDEALGASVKTAWRDRFASLDRVRELLVDLVPDLADPATLDRYLLILHHCYSFWEAGCRHYAFEESTVRSVIATPPDISGWSPRTPRTSIYVELPQNLFWSAVVEGEPPEPAEGLFVSLRGDGWVDGVDILLVLGVRPDRPGFSVAELTVDLAAARAISEPDAFAADLPGADLANLYSLRRPAEVVTLLLRLLWYVETYPESVEQKPGRATADHGAAGQTTATTFGYHRVRPVERSNG